MMARFRGVSPRLLEILETQACRHVLEQQFGARRSASVLQGECTSRRLFFKTVIHSPAVSASMSRMLRLPLQTARCMM